MPRWALVVLLTACSGRQSTGARDAESAGESDDAFANEWGEEGTPAPVDDRACDAQGRCWRAEALTLPTFGTGSLGVPQFGDVDGDGLIELVAPSGDTLRVIEPLTAANTATLTFPQDFDAGQWAIIEGEGLLVLERTSSRLHLFPQQGANFGGGLELPGTNVRSFGVLEQWLDEGRILATLEGGEAPGYVLGDIADGVFVETHRVDLPELSIQWPLPPVLGDLDADGRLDIFQSSARLGLGSTGDDLALYDILGAADPVPQSFFGGVSMLWRSPPVSHFALATSDMLTRVVVEDREILGVVASLEFPFRVFGPTAGSEARLAVSDTGSIWVVGGQHSDGDGQTLQPWVQRVTPQDELELLELIGLGDHCPSDSPADSVSVRQAGAGGVRTPQADELLTWVDDCDGARARLWAILED